MKPKELEKRLGVAYDAGFFDGYHQGIEDTHEVWVSATRKVKGIGKKRLAAIMIAMYTESQRRAESKSLGKGVHIDVEA